MLILIFSAILLIVSEPVIFKPKLTRYESEMEQR